MTALGHAFMQAGLRLSRRMATCQRKHRFTDREKAAGIGVGRDGYKLYTYFCEQCKGWHLSKKLRRK